MKPSTLNLTFLFEKPNIAWNLLSQQNQPIKELINVIPSVFLGPKGNNLPIEFQSSIAYPIYESV